MRERDASALTRAPVPRAAIERRLVAAAPPAEVLKAARAELRKLRRGNEASPGHAAGRAWVEWLSLMPWSATSPPGAAA
jgi:ATP-dependent Lon protease